MSLKNSDLLLVQDSDTKTNYKVEYEDLANQITADVGGGAVDSVNGKNGTVILDAADVSAATTAQGAKADSAVQPGDDVSDLNNDAGYITASSIPVIPVTSVNTKTGAVVLNAGDVGAATTAQGALADSAVQPGDNVSGLNNDAGYITAADVPDEGLWKIDGTAVTPKTAGADLDIEGNINASGTITAAAFDLESLPALP